MQNYFGAYKRFETANKKDAALLLGADNVIGDTDNIALEYRDAHHEAWIISRFDQRIGYFDPAFSRTLAVRAGEGLTNVAILALVAFTDTPDPGLYWGEAAVISYDATDDVLNAFVERVAHTISEGNRPNIDISADALNDNLASNATWMPSSTVPLPERKPGTVWMKRHRTLSEKMIETARVKRVGCSIASWVILLAIVALIVWLLHSCSVF